MDFSFNNKTFSISKQGEWKNQCYVYKMHSEKHVDDTYSKNIVIGNLNLSYINYDYDNVCHVILKPDYKFSKTECAESVEKLRQLLEQYVHDDNFVKQRPPFSFAVESVWTDDGQEQHVFYITAKKQWFIDNNLKVLVNKLFRGTVLHDELVKNKHKFPKYRLFFNEIIYL